MSNVVFSQIGSDIVGNVDNAGAGITTCISNNGNTVAISYYGENNGVIRVFSNINNNWVQLGNDIVGGIDGSIFGVYAHFSNNGNRIITVDRTDNLTARIYIFELSNNNWVQVGNIIEITSNENVLLNSSFSISGDGNTIIVNNIEDVSLGIIKIKCYELSNNTWVQKGNTIQGYYYLQVGVDDFTNADISITGDGSKFINVFNEIDVCGNVINFFVRLFTFNNNNWVQLGNDIVIPKENGDNFNHDVFSIINNDGNRILVEKMVSEDVYDLSLVKNEINVYELSNNNWIQIGNTIQPPQPLFSLLITSSISGNGSKVIVSGITTPDKNINSIMIYVYELFNNNWVQQGQPIEEIVNKRVDTNFRNANISGDGTRFISGNPYYDFNNLINAGRARIFEIPNNTQPPLNIVSPRRNFSNLFHYSRSYNSIITEKKFESYQYLQLRNKLRKGVISRL